MALKLADFKPGDRVEHINSVTKKIGTVTRTDREYVRVRWDGQDYNQFYSDSGVYPYNLRKLPEAVQVSSDLGLAVNLRRLADSYREKARSANRAADKAEALAKEIEAARL